ncbi:MAG: DUF3427 domain-containing protein [Ahniella sp.]|nr:DUF3427 domain-containing protein [Ahniella sp.]
MGSLHRGLYEQLITAALESELRRGDVRLVKQQTPLTDDEAADRIALHLSRLVKQAIGDVDGKKKRQIGIQLARRVIALLEEETDSGIGEGDRIFGEGDVLRAISARMPNGMPEDMGLPATPLLDTTLLTNAPGEPRIGHQIRTEIPSSDRIDILMAFVRRSGIRPNIDLLQRHVEAGRRIRVLTTTYTNSTELEALVDLQKLGAEVRVSYDTTGTRLHAKAWLFHRASGYSTAFIGSSNLTHSAQVTGMEWNVRVSGARNPDVVDKFNAVFDSYWSNDDFRPFDESEFSALSQPERLGPHFLLSPIQIRLEPFQARLLEQIEISRVQGNHRNLLVSATGTGKTVMAAVDYCRLRQRLPRSRLLFVAHRKEILNQARLTYGHALADPAFGECWFEGRMPNRFDHVFASIQTLSAQALNHLAADHFDVVVIDEFHHAESDTYARLLDHLRPIELLGLTATPERSDGRSVTRLFEGRISAELRLWDAIDQHRLCPFAYFGISDETDLRNVTWSRGTGYSVAELDNGVLTGNDVLARHVIAQVRKHVPNAATFCALGFCVSIKHAHFMARHFNDAGFPAAAISSNSSTNERDDALGMLKAGLLRIIFAVDLFNEGVDVPQIDTLLMLRPTDSATLAIQQLGRGLRRHTNKSVCTVLDFVSQHRREFQFHRRLGAILGGTRKGLERQVAEGFPFLPSGFHMQLDSVATDRVLRSIKDSLPRTVTAKAREIEAVAQQVAATYGRLTLTKFLAETGMTVDELYTDRHSWSDLLDRCNLPTLPPGPEELTLRRALCRLTHIDDLERIRQYSEWVRQDSPPDTKALGLRARRLLHMLIVSLLDQVPKPGQTLQEGAALLWQHPQVRAELGELMEALETRIQHVAVALSTHDDVPLNIHARYTRNEVLAAFSDGHRLAIPLWQSGVLWMPDQACDLLAFTLDKSGNRFSPTTRYRDYAINRSLIHWESQSRTKADSQAGLRYQNHEALGSSIFLFVRISPDSRASWFLGPAKYVSHEGERPMAIKWELTEPISGDLFPQLAAIAG